MNFFFNAWVFFVKIFKVWQKIGDFNDLNYLNYFLIFLTSTNKKFSGAIKRSKEIYKNYFTTQYNKFFKHSQNFSTYVCIANCKQHLLQQFLHSPQKKPVYRMAQSEWKYTKKPTKNISMKKVSSCW